MRRKMKFGIYTNATIKRCYCDYFCVRCKGLCKAVYKSKQIFDSFTHTASPSDIRNRNCKFHQFGFGSLMPGKKCIIFDKKYHRSNKFRQTTIFENEIQRNKANKDLKSEGYECWDFYVYIKNFSKNQKF